MKSIDVMGNWRILDLTLELKLGKYDNWNVNWHHDLGNLIINLGEFLGQSLTHSNMGVVSFRILLWLFVWMDCIDLEVNRKRKTQVLE